MLRRLALIGFALAALATGLGPATGVAQPAGFVDEVVPGLGSVSQPTAFAFLPNGDLLIATKPGQLLLYTGGALRATPVFDRVIDTCSDSERGLLGVAVDPAFTTSRTLYVYYTFDRANSKETAQPDCERNTANAPVNRVSRLTLSAALTTAEELVLVDNIPSPNGNHNAGDLQFGKDGYLYISAGDGGSNNDTARQRYNLNGAILRITRDGGIPADNPYTGAGTARCYDPAPGGNKSGAVAPQLICREIFAYGLRNPFRLAFDPNVATTRFYINDVGQNSAEEIDLAAPGADYGWDCYEGTLVYKTDGICNPLPQGSVPPLFEYQRPAPAGQAAIFDGCRSLTGGAFVPDGLWPSAYDGAYLFGDYVCDRIFALRAAAGGPTPELLLEGRTTTHMAFGLLGGTQALYYADFGAGAIRRLRYAGAANRTPVAALTRGPLGADPLTAALDASGSTDAEGAIAAYLWNFGDGKTATTTAPTVSHTYAQGGTYTVTLRVRDGQGATSYRPATLSVTVNDPGSAPDALYLPLIGR
jgi:glucose/arabinose dehydrogenase